MGEGEKGEEWREWEWWGQDSIVTYLKYMLVYGKGEHNITAGQVPRELNWLGWEGKYCFHRKWLETFNWVKFHAVQQSIIKYFKISPLMATGYKPVRYKVWE